MKVVVKTLDSKNQELEVPNESSVRQLKEKIAQEMNIPVEKQRLIFQGKVLKEGKQLKDYGDLDGKVIHLVQSAPPPEAMETSTATSSSSTSSTSSTSSSSTSSSATVTSSIPTHTRSDVLFVSTMPVLPGSDIAQMTQHLVSNIVDSLTASGQHASVSAHAQMVDASTGRTHEHVVASATTGGMPGSAPGIAQGMEQRQQNAEQVEQDRSRHQLREIYQHMRTARRCLNYAKAILDNFESVQSGEESGAQSARSGEVSGAQGATGGPQTTPPQETTPPSVTVHGTASEESAGGSDLQPVGANLYAHLLEEHDHLCARIYPLNAQYVQLIRQDTSIPVSSVVRVQRLAQVIKDLNYYMGHTQLALSRLHVCMNSEIPRVVRLVPPRRSELRRAMHHLRSFTVPPPELLFDLARSQMGRGQGVANGGRDQGTTPTAGPQQQASVQATPPLDVPNRAFQGIRLGPISFGATFNLQDPQGGGASSEQGPNISVSANGQPNVAGGSHGNEEQLGATPDLSQLLSSIIGNFMHQTGAQASSMGGASGTQQSAAQGAQPPSGAHSAPNGGQQGRGPDITINFPLAPTFQMLSSLLQQRSPGQSASVPSQSASAPGQSAAASGQFPFSQSQHGSSGSGDEEDTVLEEDSFELELDTPTDLSDPMARLTNAALEDMLTGSRQTIADIIHGMREEIGMEVEGAADMSMVEQLLQIISSQLSVYEVMSVFRGNVQPLRTIQPSLRAFLRDRVLQGVEPTEEHCARAVEVFLEGVVPSLGCVVLSREQQGLSLCMTDIDFPRTVHRVLSTIMDNAYQRVIASYSGDGFPEAMRTWATDSAALFGALLRHITGSDEGYELVASQLLGLLFPPSTPQPILVSCSASVLSEMNRLRCVVSHTPEVLDGYVVRCAPSAPSSSHSVPSSSHSAPSSSHSAPSSSHTCGTTLFEGTPLASVQPPKPLEEQLSDYPDTMPQEWIPVINADREAMEGAEPQKPFSDAYASSMPMKKRKMENGKAEVSSLSELLTSSVEKAVQQTGATPTSGAPLDVILQEVRDDQELLDCMGEEMHGAMTERLERDPDFSPLKFPQAQKLYNPRK